ncbi:MAG: alkaline phosphatase family protein [Nitrososphaerota archaeon]|nr:alkaline phosphatase family protein [Nitrososphaerota archaeon]
MLDRSIEKKLTSKRFEGEFVIPSYDNYCLSSVPSTIASLLGLETSRPTLPLDYISGKLALGDLQNIVLLVIDGFGYDAWLRSISDGEFFQTVTEKGLVFPITTVFPSTTAAALTTLSTGLTPQEHGLPEWYVYMKEVDMIITTLPFTPMGESMRDALVGRMDPRILFSGETVYSSFAKSGIHSISLLPAPITRGAYTKLSLKGSNVVPYFSLADFAVTLRKQLKSLEGKTFVYAYWDAIDSSSHAHGPSSDSTQAEISSFSYVMKREFLDKLDRNTAQKTLLIITADHGQIDVSPQDTLYLNHYPKVVNAFEKSRQGNSILPSWSPRDVVLHVKKDRVDEVQSALADILGNNAVVLRSKDAIEMGLFGINNPSRRFMERAGDLLVLPRDQKLVWYEHTKGRQFELLGVHGGLSQNEMLIPLGLTRL